MQFKHPELLYALLLLAIPIIVHLFQLRRFKKVPFTNVEFLKNVTLQTRKSSQLKKWLTLLTRLLLLAAVIIAFAQPFTSQTEGLDVTSETVIYLDNSFSMQAKGDKGELLKRAVQDLLNSVDENETVSIFTNDNTFRNVTLKGIRNELLQLEYSVNQLDYDNVQLKGKKLFSSATSNVVKNFVLISDFQQNKPINTLATDSVITTYVVPLRPEITQNVSIDSVYISKSVGSTIELSVKASQQNASANASLPVSLFHGDKLISKTAIGSTPSETVQFTLPANEKINGRITIDDGSLTFDNTLFFNINEREKVNVLAINEAEDDFLERVYSEDEFNYESVAFNQLNYNTIASQNLIILNELTNVPVALSNALNAFIENDGYILIIPSSNADLNSYNQLINSQSSVVYQRHEIDEKQVTTINYAHSLFNDVFDKKVTNFQYPKVDTYIKLGSTVSPILQFEDGQSFLTQSGNVFLFTAALNAANSNVTNSPLIVPTLYNIGRQSFKIPQLYYTIGEENTYDVKTSLQQDAILKLRSEKEELIPQQRTTPNKVTLTTLEVPRFADTYHIIKGNEIIEDISYNYNREESQLNYHSLDNLENFNMVDSIPEVINSIKSSTSINALWKWFAIFALIFLIIEMLILKFYR